MIQIVYNNAPWNKAAAFYIRMLVFVQEQGMALANDNMCKKRLITMCIA